MLKYARSAAFWASYYCATSNKTKKTECTYIKKTAKKIPYGRKFCNIFLQPVSMKIENSTSWNIEWMYSKQLCSWLDIHFWVWTQSTTNTILDISAKFKLWRVRWQFSQTFTADINSTPCNTQQTQSHGQHGLTHRLSLRFKDHFPDEPELAGFS